MDAELNQTGVEFRAFPKMARLNRPIIITEKIDGTNAQIFIGEDGLLMAGSKNRWLTPEEDNFGFARWAKEHKEELLTLGPGRHFGEFWGAGIQRNYGLAEKRFSLFNVERFCLHGEIPRVIPSHNNPTAPIKYQTVLPPCVGLVPVLGTAPGFSSRAVDRAIYQLEQDGSAAAPGFMKPEGVVIWHTAANAGFKRTIENDGSPKGEVA